MASRGKRRGRRGARTSVVEDTDINVSNNETEQDEDLKRAIELSLKSAQEDEHKRNSVADSDDDEELKKALAISLKQITGNENSGSNDPSGESVTISSESSETESENSENADPAWSLSDDYEENDIETFSRPSSKSRLSSEEATKRMRTVFRKGLESKLNSVEMEPCKGIITPLHPYQKAALAWMCNQENKENQGMVGGILGDKSTLNTKLKRDKGKSTTGLGAYKFFNKESSSESEEDIIFKQKNAKNTSRNGNKAELNSESENDDFDKMLQESKTNLRKKFENKTMDEIINPEEEEMDEMFSKWDNMSQEEKDAIFKNTMQSIQPKLNLDGFLEFENEDDNIEFSANLNLDGHTYNSESDDEYIGKRKRVNLNSISSEEESSQTNHKRTRQKKIRSDSNYNVSGPSTSSENNVEPEKEKSNLDSIEHIKPPKEPAVRGNRRRPTLIVCPASLLGHWCTEIDKHVDESINVKVKVHHGSTKALIGGELNSCDIVLTTYGTLASNLDSDDHGPLLKAKWLRVVLDEGHCIKNHRSKTAMAAQLLDTKRRWVMTGTPIQNNLMDMWSLVHWLRFDLYSNSINDFKIAIERPCKNREPVGFERLQTLMDTICLRRTKNDKKENGEPIVQLPTKTVIMRDVKFTEDERFCYDLMKQKATEIVARYQRQGKLMRNYAHIFVLMLRLRQMCCHRELITEIDWSSTMTDKDALQKELETLNEVDGDIDGSEANHVERAKLLAKKLSQMIRDGVTDDCSICLDDLRSPVITLCSHIYCRECIERVIQTTKPPLCPLCRGDVKKSELLEATDPILDEDDENKVSAETLKKLESIEYNFSSSKVNAAIKEIIRIREEAPDDKVIVVSQFTSFLSIIQPLLTKEGFKFVRLDGSMSQTGRKETIDEFQCEGPNTPTVMLLSLKAGGVGLNLTAANHLLLLDPAWNPAAEWQCFDRIHRMGQTKDVFIYKFIVKDDSIEENMLKIQRRKEDIINGAFHMPDDERRRQRIDEILTIFNLQN